MKYPELEAIVTESRIVFGEYNLKGITTNGHRALKLLLKGAGFKPGDIVTIKLKEEDDGRI